MKVYRQPPKAKSIQAKNLDNNILQTQTVRSLISLLRRTGEITKNHTNHEKAINKEIEFVIECHEKALRRTRAGRKVSVLSDNHFTGIYKVNL